MRRVPPQCRLPVPLQGTPFDRQEQDLMATNYSHRYGVRLHVGYSYPARAGSNPAAGRCAPNRRELLQHMSLRMAQLHELCRTQQTCSRIEVSSEVNPSRACRSRVSWRNPRCSSGPAAWTGRTIERIVLSFVRKTDSSTAARMSLDCRSRIDL